MNKIFHLKNMRITHTLSYMHLERGPGVNELVSAMFACGEQDAAELQQSPKQEGQGTHRNNTANVVYSRRSSRVGSAEDASAYCSRDIRTLMNGRLVHIARNALSDGIHRSRLRMKLRGYSHVA